MEKSTTTTSKVNAFNAELLAKLTNPLVYASHAIRLACTVWTISQNKDTWLLTVVSAINSEMTSILSMVSAKSVIKISEIFSPKDMKVQWEKVNDVRDVENMFHIMRLTNKLECVSTVLKNNSRWLRNMNLTKKLSMFKKMLLLLNFILALPQSLDKNLSLIFRNRRLPNVLTKVTSKFLAKKATIKASPYNAKNVNLPFQMGLKVAKAVYIQEFIDFCSFFILTHLLIHLHCH